jgi:hypothetical protein
MLAPLVLGYVIGAVGFYSLLHKTAMVVDEKAATASGSRETEIVELFPARQEERKAA